MWTILTVKFLIYTIFGTGKVELPYRPTHAGVPHHRTIVDAPSLLDGGLRSVEVLSGLAALPRPRNAFDSATDFAICWRFSFTQKAFLSISIEKPNIIEIKMLER